MAEEDLRWRGEFENAEANALHAEAFGHRILPIDWVGQARTYSLGWVTARDGGKLVGFVNVAWDGGVHAFLLDTMVAMTHRRRGIGARLVAMAEAEARAAGCEWLHVDFDEHLRLFYLDACGFRTAPAGVIQLTR
jgi:ribosomal protein S18 acetylase RimI-like enzyme